LKAVRESDEFADLVSAARTHVGHTLREIASMVEGGSDDDGEPTENVDLVDRVRHIFGRG
jgi:hypothetical protein